jgi:carbonic anhydrase/acetyltransferase-like protein (isoleucine patch superfamily)
MVYGSPAKVARSLTAEEQAGLRRWAEKYVEVAKAHAGGFPPATGGNP